MKNMDRRKKHTNKTLVLILVLAVLAAVIITFAAVAVLKDTSGKPNGSDKNKQTLGGYAVPDYVDVQLIDVDGHARRGVKLEGGVKDIVIHYVANPMSTAQNNRDYFNKETTTVSSHFVIGLDGEVIQCVPLDEKSSASNDRNRDTISIEVCHEDETGKFNDATYKSLVKLTAWLCRAANLDENHIIRHYDITGKLCPLYFVEHEDEWEVFKADVAEHMHNITLVKAN